MGFWDTIDTKSLTDRLDNDADGWRPEAGDTIIGRVVDIGTNDGGYGPYNIYILDTPDGKTAIHAFHTVLKNELENAEIGDVLAIKYQGMVKTKDGKGEFHGYRVVYDRAAKPAPPTEEEVSRVAAAVAADPEPAKAKRGGKREITGQGDEIPFSPTTGPWGY